MMDWNAIFAISSVISGTISTVFIYLMRVAGIHDQYDDDEWSHVVLMFATPVITINWLTTFALAWSVFSK